MTKLTIKKQIQSLPQKPGAYLFKDKTGRLLYIGKAANLRNRVRSHFERFSLAQKNTPIKNYSEANEKRETPHRKPLPPEIDTGLSGAGWHDMVTDIDFILAADAKEALLLENELIKKYQPRYNIQWRDDKSYFWVAITADEWPRVKIAHKPNIMSADYNSPSRRQNVDASPPLKLRGGWGELFPPLGPFVNGTELKHVLRALRKILPYRTCKNSYDKPCLQWHLGLCPAHRSPEFNRGGEGGPAHGKNPPQPSFLKEGGADFFQKSARVDLKKYRKSLDTLKQLLRLYAGQPLRVEAYDISNIQGTNATGSMIVFRGFKRDRSRYRKFRIKTVRRANDVAMLKEVLRRRLNHQEWPLPDLMLIDGGRAQLNAALSLIANRKSQKNPPQSPFSKEGDSLLYKRRVREDLIRPIAIISLAKREEELYTIYSNRPLPISKLPTSFRLLFQAIRNEAHRFAITYYRHLHGKKFKRGTAPKKT